MTIHTGDLGSMLLGRNEVKESLERFDDLTNEEHLRIATETHVAVHNLSESVRKMRSDVADIFNAVTERMDKFVRYLATCAYHLERGHASRATSKSGLSTNQMRLLVDNESMVRYFT